MRTQRVRVAGVALAALVWAGELLAAGLEGGGVRLDVDAGLRVTGLRVAGAALTVARAPLLEICDVATGAYTDATAQSESAPSGWTLRFEPARASTALRVSQEAQALRFACTVAGDPGPARGILLRFNLPFDATGWRWHNDLQTSEEVTGARTHTNVRPLRAYADLPEWADQPDLRMGYSNRNFCTVLSGPVGLCLAVPIDRPCLFRTVYDGAAKRLEIVFDFALSPDTRVPHQAEFAFDLYACDPAWGFRAALAHYYALYPELFRVHIREQGQWMAFNRLSQIDNANEFGFGLQEGAPEPEYDDQIGVLSTIYFTHAGMGANLTGYDPEKDPLPALDVQVAAVEKAFRSRTGRDDMFRQVGLYTPAGALDVQKWRVYNHLIAQFNLDPELPYGAWTLERAVAQTAEIKAKRNADLDGFYYDGLSAGVNYRPDHFKTADSPCLWDPVAKKPFINNFFSSCEFARAAAERLRPRGQITMMNGAVGSSFYVAPWLDVLGEETGLRISRADLNYIRATTYHKPFMTLLKGNYEQQIGHAEMALFMKRCLAYGIFPGFFDWPPSGMGPGGQYWNHPRYYERDRDLFRTYQPLCRALALAGWEPLTHARSSDAEVYVERFGPGADGIVWLTLLNEDKREHRTRLTIDAVALGLEPAAVRATDVLSGVPVALTGAGGGLAAELSLPADGVVALQLATPDRAGRWRAAQALATLASGQQMREVDKDKPARPVHWLAAGSAVTRTAAAGGVTLSGGTSSPTLSQWVMLFQNRPSEVTVRVRAMARELSAGPGTAGLRCRAAWLSPSFAYYEENVFDLPAGSYDARDLTFTIASAHALRAIQVTAFMKPGATGALTLARLSVSDGNRAEYAADPDFAAWYEPVPAGLRERVTAECGTLRGALEALAEGAGGPAAARARLGAAFGTCRKLRDLVAAEKAENGCRRVLRDVATIEPHLGFVALAAYGLEPPRLGGPASAAPGDTVALTFAAPTVSAVPVTARLECAGAEVVPTATGGTLAIPADARPGDALVVTGTLALGAADQAVDVSARHTIHIVRPLELTLCSDGVDTTRGGVRVRAALTNHRAQTAAVTLTAQPPSGWSAEPPRRVDVPAGGEVMTEWVMVPPAALTAGVVDFAASASTDGATATARLALFHIPAEANRLRNPGFEDGLANWSPNEGRPAAESAVARSGKGSLRLANAVSAATGVSQTVTLNQTTPGAILVRAASKAQGISGDPGKGYSLYVDIYYTDGTPLYGRTHDFQTGTTDWQSGELYIEPAKPIRNVNVYLLLRGKSGTAWFDDVALMEDPRRKGNLAREAAVTVDSNYSGYDPSALTDGLTEVADLHWTKQAWASAESATEHTIVLAFKEPRPVARAVIYWSLDAGISRTSAEVLLQVPEAGGWKTVGALHPETAEAASELRLPQAVTAARFRVLQPVGRGPTGRKDLLWVREVELFAE